MYLTSNDIQSLEKISRLNLINALSGLKPANLIGTQSSEGILNVTIFSSVVHLGSNPALFGMVLRPNQDVKRDTYNNIQETGYYTINHIHESFVKRAHYTSAKFPSESSEFDQCDLTPQWIHDFPAPFVQESPIQLGMKWEQSIPIPINDTLLVVGSVEHLIVPDEAIEPDWQVDLAKVMGVGIAGLNSYYSITRQAQYPYARPDEIPDSWDDGHDKG